MNHNTVSVSLCGPRMYEPRGQHRKVLALSDIMNMGKVKTVESYRTERY